MTELAQNGRHPRSALVVGSQRPFGQEIVRRLRRDGYEVTEASAFADVGQTSIATLEALIINAPVEQAALRFRDITDQDFRVALDDRLFESFAAAQFAVSRMPEGGTVVQVASRAHLGTWGGAQDAAVGAALVALGRSMALELSLRSIRVNTVAPDHVGGAWDTSVAREELAELVAWLAGPASALLSGETIMADRGKSLQMAQAARR